VKEVSTMIVPSKTAARRDKYMWKVRLRMSGYSWGEDEEKEGEGGGGGRLRRRRRSVKPGQLRYRTAVGGIGQNSKPRLAVFVTMQMSRNLTLTICHTIFGLKRLRDPC
jgi:hypothetical protein